MPRFKVDAVRKAIPRRVAGLLAGLALASATGSAIAQDRTQSPPPEPRAEDLLALRQFARCAVLNDRRRAAALLVDDYTSETYGIALRRLVTGNNSCLPPGSRLQFGGVLFAGNLAELLLRRTAPRGTLAERVAYNAAAAPIRARSEGDVMSMCVVRAAPVEIDALLDAAPGSAEETAAVRAITPQIGPCLVSGVAMRFNRPGLRAVLALAAYRLVRHNAATAAVATAGN
jgi:hypothetical protein